MKEQRNLEELKQLQDIERQVITAVHLFENATQLWTKLEEDQKIQKWDKEEERISIAIQDIKKRQKTMSIIEHIKGAHYMKKLQAELTNAQTQKKECQAQIEPYQEWVACWLWSLIIFLIYRSFTFSRVYTP
jgi:hypothetical protein